MSTSRAGRWCCVLAVLAVASCTSQQTAIDQSQDFYRLGNYYQAYWVLEDARGREVAKIREKKISIRDAVKIELDGVEATVKKAMIGFRDRFNVDVDPGEDLKVHGNIVDHEYEIERDGHKIAEVSKKWFRVRDTYGVEVHNVLDVPLVLAVTVAVDALSDRGR